jgi:hypothetical protein
MRHRGSVCREPTAYLSSACAPRRFRGKRLRCSAARAKKSRVARSATACVAVVPGRSLGVCANSVGASVEMCEGATTRARPFSHPRFLFVLRTVPLMAVYISPRGSRICFRAKKREREGIRAERAPRPTAR